MHKFPSIDQFRHAVRHARDLAASANQGPPKLNYLGTVKLHGTNAGIQQDATGYTYMSRNRTLRVGDDNAGFAGVMETEECQVILDHLFSHIGVAHDVLDLNTPIQVFGEWCGEGIQKGVAVSQLSKRFVIFAIRIGDEWVSLNCLKGFSHHPIHAINNFPTWTIKIDMACPELAQNEMVAITEAVERECPVGKAFGVSGIGEGVVWTCLDDPRSELWFKVKGEKHSVTKVAKLAAVDTERFRARDDLVNAIITDQRCAQGVDHLQREMGLTLEIKNIGHYLRWVFNDATKEESDTIAASGFEPKKLGKPISDVAKRYFMKALDAELMDAAA